MLMYYIKDCLYWIRILEKEFLLLLFFQFIFQFIFYLIIKIKYD